MKRMNRNSLMAVAAVLALAVLLAPASVAGKIVTQLPDNAYTVTFDNGPEGWDFERANCATLNDDGGNPGAFMNFSRYCDGIYHLTGWFEFDKEIQLPFNFEGNLEGGLKIGIDFDVNFYDYMSWFGPIAAEQWRAVVVELRDYDNPYVDPDTGYSWPWTSVMYVMGYLPDRNDGWKHFEVEIEDIGSETMPEGWTGFGGPEDPNTYMPQLPPDRTFGDVIAGTDEIVFSSLEPGYFYQLSFVHDLNVDNITFQLTSPSCKDLPATIYVDGDGVIHGGDFDGQTYSGVIEGTEGNDVIAGTSADDVINGLGGNDVICGRDGGDSIDGGEGFDVIEGGLGVNVCTNGEMTFGCTE